MEAVLPGAQGDASTRRDVARRVVEARRGPSQGFFTSYDDGKHAVCYYGDNHPHYAGSVVKAMASAKDGYPEVAALFPANRARLGDEPQAARDARRGDLFAKLDDELSRAVARGATASRRPSSRSWCARPPPARKFRPGQFYRLQNFEVERATSSTARASRWRASRSRAPGSTRRRGSSGRSSLEMGVSLAPARGAQAGRAGRR